jgi:transcriptional regulator with XRE-family HTH domain
MKNLIRQERERKKMSQTQLAILAGLSNSLVSEFERGVRRPWPKARTAIAKALGVSETELFPEGQ